MYRGRNGGGPRTSAKLKLLNDRYMLGSHLSDEQRFDITAPAEILEDGLQASQVDRIFRQASATIDAHRDRKCRPLGKVVVAIEQSKRLNECRPFDHLFGRDNASGQLPHPGASQSVHQVF